MVSTAIEIIDITDDPCVFDLNQEDATKPDLGDQTAKAMGARIRMLERELRALRFQRRVMALLFLGFMGACAVLR